MSLILFWQLKKSVEQEQGKIDILINSAKISGALPQHTLNTSNANMHEVFKHKFLRSDQRDARSQKA